MKRIKVNLGKRSYDIFIGNGILKNIYNHAELDPDKIIDEYIEFDKKIDEYVKDTSVYLNNVGYSYLLRGNLPQARRYFLKAYEIDPKNETVANNLQLLNNSVTVAQRN